MRLLNLLKSKIHHARVSYANPDYVGSVEISAEIMRRSGIEPGEYVYVWNVENGERFNTYAFPTDESCVVGVNGAAAHRVTVGDRLIIACFAFTDEKIVPQIILMDEKNSVVRDLKPYSKTGD